MGDHSHNVKVSVIIPNYNHARFLEKRLLSIFNQTYQDFEVICLDDASTDNSQAILAQFATHPKMRAILLNTMNSGNPFTQWNKGIQAANGEYIWIAESDDYADEHLLETLVARLDQNPQVGTAYCQSWQIDEQDKILLNFDEHWTADLDPERWRHDFTNTGQNECRHYLIVKNTIPNASAVVFRRSIWQLVGGAPEELKLGGDWLFWAKMLLVSDIAFVAKPLNYFRTHAATIRMVQTQHGLNIEESFKVLHYLAQHIEVPQDQLHEILKQYLDTWLEAGLNYHIPLSRHRVIYRIAHTISAEINGVILQRIPPFLKKILRQSIATIRMRLKVKTRWEKAYHQIFGSKIK